MSKQRGEFVPVESLQADPHNVRTHGDANLAAIRASLLRFGQVKPIVVDAANRVIAGNGTLEVVKSLGWETIWVARTELEGDEATAYAIADNRTAELAEWDFEKLGEQLKSLNAAELMGFTGFDEAAFENMLPAVEITEDDVPEPPADPITKPGDVWLMGEHRLLCGDSTRAEDVAALMDGETATACITDPPYSVNYEESHKTRGGNKTVHEAYHEADINPSDLLSFLGLIPADVLLFSYSVNRHMFVLCEMLRRHKWEIRKELVWVKDTFSFWMGAAYQQRHEPIWICTRNGAGFRGNVQSKESTVLEYKRPKAHNLHPTAKPIELWAKFVENHTNRGELLFEPFSGSGTTLIAAEQLGRVCYGIEISPAYCDVIVRRWEKLTGRSAIKAPKTSPVATP